MEEFRWKDETLTVVLFAGGLSTRMGTDKATLCVAGEPLWARQLKTLRALKPERILISARERPAWCPEAIEVVLDQQPSRGPLSGLTAALKSIETSRLLALAVDLPLVTSAILSRLQSMARPGCGVLPLNGEQFEPLCAIYPVEAADAACAQLAGGEFSLQQLARRLLREGRVVAHSLSEGDRRFFLNANTPADFSACGPA